MSPGLTVNLHVEGDYHCANRASRENVIKNDVNLYTDRTEKCKSSELVRKVRLIPYHFPFQ